MDSPGKDLDEQLRRTEGKAAAYRGIAVVTRKQAAAAHRAADRFERKAKRKDAKADRIRREMVVVAITAARNEEAARAAVATAEETADD